MLTVCLVIPCFSMLTYAANGKIMFTDPSAASGQTVEVVGVIERTDRTGFGKVEITMKYDTEILKFKSGAGITESQAGTITYSGDATNDVGSRHEFKIQFDALKGGTAKLEIESATVKSVSGNVLNYTKGSSTIKVTQAADTPAPSTPATGSGEGKKVEVNGEEYTLSNTFPENDIPKGYEKSTLEYDFETYNVVYSEESGLYLAYLVNAESFGKFFMYVEEDATFAPFELIEISDSVSIALLSDVSSVALPKEYNKTQVILKDQEFPAWHNVEEEDFYIIYAINSQGEKGLYQLDNAEGTYQRFTAPEVVEEKEEETFIDKLGNILQNHMDKVILGTGLGFLLLIIVIIILGVKLYNRNAELDEIYDEYGLDEEDETEDDVVLDLEDEEYEDEEENVEDEKTEDSEAELFVQEGMKEVFPEEDLQVDANEETEEQIAEELPKVFAEEANLEEAEEQSDYYDEEDAFENFSIDFIDLDD